MAVREKKNKKKVNPLGVAEMTNEMLRHRYAVYNAGSDMWGFKFSEIHEEDLKNGNILFNFLHSPALQFLHTI